MKQLLAWTGSADSTITSDAVMVMDEKFNTGQCRNDRIAGVFRAMCRPVQQRRRDVHNKGKEARREGWHRTHRAPSCPRSGDAEGGATYKAND
jgi:hypothetical protein